MIVTKYFYHALCIAFVFASCKKRYTCTCSGHGKSISETKLYKTLEEAEAACEGYNATAQQYGGNCALE